MTDLEHAAQWVRNGRAPILSEHVEIIAPMFAAWYVSDAEEMAYWERCGIGMTRIFECFMEAQAAQIAQAIRVEDAARDMLAGFNA